MDRRPVVNTTAFLDVPPGWRIEILDSPVSQCATVLLTRQSEDVNAITHFVLHVPDEELAEDRWRAVEKIRQWVMATVMEETPHLKKTRQISLDD